MPGTEKKKAQDRARMQRNREAQKTELFLLREVVKDIVSDCAGCINPGLYQLAVEALNSPNSPSSKAQKDISDE